MIKKIVELEKLKKILPQIKKKKKILVGGCFDVFHYGHLLFLRKEKEQGDTLIIALESDDFIRQHKKREQVHTQKQRAEILASLEFVDFIILLPLLSSYDSYLNLVKLIKPKIIAVTKGDPLMREKKRQAKAVGAHISIITSLSRSYEH